VYSKFIYSAFYLPFFLDFSTLLSALLGIAYNVPAAWRSWGSTVRRLGYH